MRKSLEILLRDLCNVYNLKHSGHALNELMVKLSEKGKIPNKMVIKANGINTRYSVAVKSFSFKCHS